MATQHTPWPRAIILVDMNAFFAAIEQLDNPAWRARPIAVTNGEQGTCIITCSYEARAFGIKTGMRLYQAKKLCPGLIQRPARHQRYVQVSRKIMAALKNITPDMEVFSVDEAFLDVTACQRLYGEPAYIGRLVKKAVFDASGLSCSIGISGDKTTAKYAAKLKKPDGLEIIPPWKAKQSLQYVPVTELCGIAEGIGNFLAKYGVRVCGDMVDLPISVLSKRFGDLGRRIWYMCQGADPEPVCKDVKAPKSMGHGKVMPPKTRDRKVIATYLLHMSEKLAARLRRNDLLARRFFIGLRHYESAWIGGKYSAVQFTDDGRVIYDLCQTMLAEHWHGEAVCQVQVTALDPKTVQQLDLFVGVDKKREQLNTSVDSINERFGEIVLPARLLECSKIPNVIAPSWKPEGHRFH